LSSRARGRRIGAREGFKTSGKNPGGGEGDVILYARHIKSRRGKQINQLLRRGVIDLGKKGSRR